MAPSKNPRKKALDAISRKIAMFLFQETFSDEKDVQRLLSEAVSKLDEAGEIMVKNDEANAPA